MQEKENKTLKEDLDILLEKLQNRSSISIKEIFNVLSGKGKPLILIFLCLPFCQPLQIPGFSIPFGIMIAFIGLQMLVDKKLWLPEKISSKTLSSAIIQKMIKKSLYILTFIKKWMRHRLTFLCSQKMQFVNGSFMIFSGLFLALPLPIPLTNLTAGWAILFINLGLLENDGLFVLIGYFICIITLLFFIFMLFSITLFFPLIK